MRFTKYHSMNDILAYPHMEEYLKIFYSEFLLEMFPKELADQPIARSEWHGKTPWGEPFTVISDQLMNTVNLILDITENKTRRCISLWDPKESEWNLEKERKGGKDSVFLLTSVPEEKEPKRRPAVIICPGGGYEAVCFSGEGTPVLLREVISVPRRLLCMKKRQRQYIEKWRKSQWKQLSVTGSFLPALTSWF